MPRRGRDSVRDRILWEYAKLIASSRMKLEVAWIHLPKGPGERRFWGTVTQNFKKLRKGDISPSAIVRENIMVMKGERRCAYCGAEDPLQSEHIIARSLGGPDTGDNLVLACSPCNQSKGKKDVHRWCRDRDQGVPRVVLGKYLKLLMDAHERHGSLDWPTYPKGEPVHLENLSRVFEALRNAQP